MKKVLAALVAMLFVCSMAIADSAVPYAANAGAAVTATTSGACTGNATTATTAGACSGNAATATTAGACSGNAATVTDGNYLSQNQTITGMKTMSAFTLSSDATGFTVNTDTPAATGILVNHAGVIYISTGTTNKGDWAKAVR
jgi:hypothetical protein